MKAVKVSIRLKSGVIKDFDLGRVDRNEVEDVLNDSLSSEKWYLCIGKTENSKVSYTIPTRNIDYFVIEEVEE